MKRLFLQLAVANTMLLIIAIVWGHVIWLTPRPHHGVAQFEALVGITALVTLTVHSFVYMYFIVAHKFILSAIEDHGYPDASAQQQSRKNKLKAFRYGFIAICISAAGAITYICAASTFDVSQAPGGVGGASGGPGLWSILTAWLTLITNLWAFRNEWKYVKANSVLSDIVLTVVSEARERLAKQAAAECNAHSPHSAGEVQGEGEAHDAVFHMTAN